MIMAALALTAVRPKLLISLRDRTVRAVAWLAPELGARLRLGGARPLRERLHENGFALGQPALLRIFKEENALEVWLRRGDSFQLFETYPVCDWSGELGPKLREGDGQSPEGFYAVGLRQLNPDSAYYLAFNLGFPNAYDRSHGRTGSFLMVHGDCLSVGCYAMTDRGIDDIYRLVEAALRAGEREVQAHVFPFRLTDEALARRAGHRWAAFWTNLKQGHDLFERTKAALAVRACGGRYVFSEATTGACKPIAVW
jgi:murein L,D-transpeptidase YafK